MFIYHLAQVIHNLSCQIRLTIILIFYQVVIFVLKEFYASVFHLYERTCPVFIVTYIEPNGIVLARYQNAVNLFTIAFFVQFAILLLCIRANLAKLLCFRAC